MPYAPFFGVCFFSDVFRLFMLFYQFIKGIESCSLGSEWGDRDAIISYRIGIEGKVTAIRFEKMTRLLIDIAACMYKLVGEIYTALSCKMVALIIEGDIDVIKGVKLEQLILLYQRPNIVEA